MAKTLRSRIAAVAVVALGLGLLQAAPSFAASSAVTADKYKSVADEDVALVATFTITGTPTTAKVVMSSGAAADLASITAASGTATVAGTATSSTATSKEYAVTGAGTVVVTIAAGAGTAGTYSVTVTADSYSATYSATKYDLSGTTESEVTWATPKIPTAGISNQATLTIHGANVTASEKNIVTISGATINDTATAASFSGETFLESAAPYYSMYVADDDTGTMTLNITTAGTVTVKFSISTSIAPLTFAAEPDMSLTFTVAAAGADTTGSYDSTQVTTSVGTAYLENGSYYASSTASSTAKFTVTTTQLDADQETVYFSKAKAVTANLSGSAGSLTSVAGTTDSSTSYSAVSAGVSATNAFSVYSDGRKGSATLTVAVNGVTQATYKFTFYGAAAKYEATVLKPYVSDDSVAATAAIAVKVTDSEGTLVPNSTVYTFASNVNVASAASAATATATSASTTFGVALLSVTGTNRGKVTFTLGNSALTITTTALIQVSGAVASDVKWEFDKATYVAGEKATIKFTLKDSDGNPIGDNAAFPLFKEAPASSAAIDLPSFTTVDVKSGVATVTAYMPNTAGSVSVAGVLSSSEKLAAALRGASTSITTTVGKPAAEQAAEAAKAEAAKATAAVAALTTTITSIQTAISTLVASVTASLTSMSAQIAKIMKKLNIK